jgi:hypothetical protein
MQRVHYLFAFVLFAISFVPTVIFLVLSGIVAPISYYMLEFSLGRSRGASGFVLMIELVQVAVYILLFYLLARLTFTATLRFSQKPYRLASQIAILVILFLCSFLPVLGEADVRGNTGVYNFWTAAYHYLKIYPAYGSGRVN